MRTLSIVIPCKDDLAIKDCLASIDEDVEIVVALNGSPPEVERLVNDFAAGHPRTIIVQAGPPNLAGALERGSRAATGQVLLYMDSDCRFMPRVIRRFQVAIETHEIVKGRVIFESGSRMSRIIADSRDHYTSEVITAFKPPLAVRTDIRDRIGGYYFDERLRWREDADLDYRIRQANIPIHFDPEAIIKHGPLTAGQDLRSGYRYGTGQARADWYGIALTNTPSSMWSAYRSKGLWAALYMALRNGLYNLGVWVEYWRLKGGIVK